MDTTIDEFLEGQSDLDFLNEGTSEETFDNDTTVEEDNKEDTVQSEDITASEEAGEMGDPTQDVVYTAMRIANELGITKPTVLNYTKRYPDYIKPSYDEKGQGFYSVEDLEVMRTISDYKKQRMDAATIQTMLEKKYGKEKQVPAEAARPVIGEEELATIISAKVEEQIRSFFEIGMKGITTRLDSVSNSMSEISNLLTNNMTTVSNQENLTRSLKGAVESTADAVSDLQKSMVSKIDRSVNRFETSISKLQTSTDQNNDIIVNDIKNRLTQNMDSITSIQKDVEKLRSSNINRRMDDLGKSVQETLDNDRKAREVQNKELISLIEEALTPPEYHPEDTAEYKELSRSLEKNKEALQKARSAVENMGKSLSEQDEKMQEKDRLISAQVAQIAALNSQVQRLKNEQQALQKTIQATPPALNYVPANPNRNFAEELEDEAFSEEEPTTLPSPAVNPDVPRPAINQTNTVKQAPITLEIPAQKKKKRFFFF